MGTRNHSHGLGRRVGIRSRISLPAHVTVAGSGETLECKATSISETGLSLEGVKLPSARERVSIDLIFPGNLSEVAVSGRVVWSANDGVVNWTRVGIALDSAIEEAQSFRDYVRSVAPAPEVEDRRKHQRRNGIESRNAGEGRVFDRRRRDKLFARAFGWMKRLNQWRNEGTYFYLKQIETGSAPHVSVGSKDVIMLASNNYLGLANHPKIVEATVAATKKYGTGSGAARLLTGTSSLHRELEEKIAAFKGSEDAIVYSTGYLANLGVISTLVESDATIFLDDKVHASIVDGSRFTGARIRVFRHNDHVALNRKLSQHRSSTHKIVIVDGVYSMDGDIARLPELSRVVESHNAMLMVDDAHATGVLGKTGRGTEEFFKGKANADIVVGTFSKALASAGGFVCGSKELVSYLKHFSRSFIFNTSMPPAICASSIAALEVIQDQPEIISQLWDNGAYMLNGLREIGYDTGLSETPIIPVMIGHETKMNKVMGYLFDNGVMVSPIGRPAVKRNSSRLRVNVMATHTRNDLDRALELFRHAYQKYGPFEYGEK